MSRMRNISSTAILLLLGCTASVIITLWVTDHRPTALATVTTEKNVPAMPPEPQTDLQTNISNGPYTKVYCLVVGNTNYPDVFGSPLRFAEDDAKEVAAELAKRYGFQVTLLIDSEATKTRIENEFQNMVAKLKPGMDFIFYFSGHGATEQSEGGPLARKGYLVPYGQL